MAASGPDWGAQTRHDAIQRKIDKLEKPKNRFNPSKPTKMFEFTRVAIGLSARKLGMDFFLDGPARPQALPVTMRTTVKCEQTGDMIPDANADAIQLANLQAAYDAGNGLFFDLVIPHLEVESDAIALEIERSFAINRDGVGLYMWFMSKGDRSTPARQKALRHEVNSFKLTAQDCQHAASIDTALSSFFEKWLLIAGNTASDPVQVSQAIDMALDAFPSDAAMNDCPSLHWLPSHACNAPSCP